MSFVLSAGALAAGAALALAGQLWRAREHRRRLSGRRPEPGAALRARCALHAGVVMAAAGLLALVAYR